MTNPAPTDAKRKAQKRQVQYLQRMFAMHPMWQATQMLELRRKALGIKTVAKSANSAEDTAKLAELRARTKAKIKSIQKEFWKMPLDQLKRNLEKLPVQRVPEFQPVVTRLRTAAACRAQFPALTQSKSMDMDLFRAFKSAVVLPPAEAGYQREKFLQKIRDKKHLKQVQKAVKHIRSDHDVLYELEKDWFETILTLKKPGAARRVDRDSYQSTSSSFELPEMGWGTWIAIAFILRLVIRFMMMNN